MWLPWQPAAVIGAVLAIAGWVLPAGAVRSTNRVAVAISAFLREAALVFGLYSIWQLAASLSLLNVDSAFGRGRWVWHAEQVLHFPSELHLQRLLLPYSW